MEIFITLVFGLILFYILNKAFKIYYFGFKGVIGALVGCYFAAFVLIGVFKESVKELISAINNWIDRIMLVFPSTQMRSRIILAIGIIFFIGYLISIIGKSKANDEKTKVENKQTAEVESPTNGDKTINR